MASVLALLASCDSLSPARGVVWELRRGETEVVLVPTIHGLSTSARRFSQQVKEHLRDSAFLLLETNPNDLSDRAAVREGCGGMKQPPTPVVSDALRKKVGAQLPELATVLNRPDLDLASLLAAMPKTPRSSTFAENSMEVQLVRLAGSLEKKTRGLETNCEQMAVIATLKLEEGQVEDLLALRLEDPDQRALENAYLAAWNEGSWQVFERIFQQRDLRFSSAAQFTNVVIRGRNSKLAQRIKEASAGQPKVFVGLGAGHFVGPHSVIDHLQAMGFKLVAAPI